MKIKFVFLLFLISTFDVCSQDVQKRNLKPYKIGFLYNYGIEDNFVFDDRDYTYTTNTYKGQVFYKLGNWKNVDFELIIQPQIQYIKHQLINEQYITPDQNNYLEKREEFTKLKSMNLYGSEFSIVMKKKITRTLDLQGSVGLGFNYIDTRTERLAKGFTFNENFSIGLSQKILKKSFLYLGSNFGHISNLNFQKPNDGYNILGVEIGYSYILNK